MTQWKRRFFTILLFFCSLHLLSAANPTEHFVLVHGAWHGAWCWFEVRAQLEEEGHTVSVVELPGHGIDFTDPLYISLPEYQDAVTAVLDQAPEPVILVGHSMGGIAISLAAEARPWKIKKLVYLAAFMLSDGQCLLDIASEDTQSQVLPNLIILPAEGIIDINRENITAMFYNYSSPNYIHLAATLLRANPLAPFATPVSLSPYNYGSIQRFYIHTTADQAITYPIQQLMVAAQPCQAVFNLDSDHSPFFSNPKPLRKILDDIAEEKY